MLQGQHYGGMPVAHAVRGPAAPQLRQQRAAEDPVPGMDNRGSLNLCMPLLDLWNLLFV